MVKSGISRRFRPSWSWKVKTRGVFCSSIDWVYLHAVSVARVWASTHEVRMLPIRLPKGILPSSSTASSYL